MIIVLAILAAIVVLFLGAWLVVGLAVKLLWWALIGIAIGALARLILPGRQAIGLVATALAGIGAAFLGGVIAHVIGVGSFLQFLIALITAVVIVSMLNASETARA
jgi:uncharacterized membrane protein YeaQ/YmgE (transglycosylase-associated protein family)